MKKTTQMDQVSGSDKRAREIGNTLLGMLLNVFAPVLEKYLSKQIVVEMLEDEQVIEFSGLLQEYSGKHLLLRNVKYKPEIERSQDMLERFVIIFPRSKALVRHCVVS